MNELSIDAIEEKLDSLRGELLHIISISRDSKELNEKLLSVSQKNINSPEILELIMYLNSSVNLDMKSMKESLIKAIDTIVIIKKNYLKKIKNLENRVSILEKEQETNNVTVLGYTFKPTQLIFIIMLSILILFTMFSVNEQAAKNTVEAIKGGANLITKQPEEK